MTLQKKPGNLILLTHKCGNVYFNKIFKKDPSYTQFQSEDIRLGEMPGPGIQNLTKIDQPFLNIRCRNFNSITTMKILTLVDSDKTNIFLCTRHPASFFRSATNYHQTSPEKWSTTQRYPHLNNQTLNDALTKEEDEDEKLIISMKHFGLAWRLPFRWLSNYQYLKSIGKEVVLLRTEDLFKNGTESYFQGIAEKMSHDGFNIMASQLMNASPITMQSLPKHSTGEFQKDNFAGFGNKAMDFYNAHFKSIESEFYPETNIKDRLLSLSRKLYRQQ